MLKTKKPTELVRSWRDGFAGFMRFVEDVQPRVLSGGRWVPFKPWEWQENVLRESFERHYKTICLSFPRRHGKTTLNMVRVLHRFLTRPNQTIGLGSCSMEQSVNVPFKMLKNSILHAPALLEIIGSENVKTDIIRFPGLNNEIRALTASEPSAYGIGFDVAWVTELAQAQTDGLYQVMSSGTGDRPDGLVLIDSTVGPKSNILYTLYDLGTSGRDKSIYFAHVTWRPGEKTLSPLIDEEWLASREKVMIPAEFRRFHCNEWVDGGNALFTEEQIHNCLGNVPSIATLRGKYRRVYFGVGGDFALGYSKHGDRSWLTTVARCVDPIETIDEQKVKESAHNLEKVRRADYYILRQVEVPLERDRQRELQNIKSFIGSSPDRISLEVYQGDSLYQWARENGFRVELIHPSRNLQVEAFTELHEIVADGRLRFSDDLSIIRQEMRDFYYDMSAVVPTFGHRDKRLHDDTVYSLVWAVHGLKGFKPGVLVW